MTDKDKRIELIKQQMNKTLRAKWTVDSETGKRYLIDIDTNEIIMIQEA